MTYRCYVRASSLLIEAGEIRVGIAAFSEQHGFEIELEVMSRLSV